MCGERSKRNVISDNCKGLSFEKEIEYAELLSNSKEYVFFETVVYVAETKEFDILAFSKDSNQYYISLSHNGNGDYWKTILEKFLN